MSSYASMSSLRNSNRRCWEVSQLRWYAWIKRNIAEYANTSNLCKWPRGYCFHWFKTVAHFFCTLECNYRRLNTKWIYCIFIFIQNKKIITRIIFLFNVAWQNFVGNNLKKTSLQDSCINNFNCSGWSFTYSGNIRKWFFYVGKCVSFTRVICSVFSLFQSLPVCIYSVQF